MFNKREWEEQRGDRDKIAKEEHAVLSKLFKSNRFMFEIQTRQEIDSKIKNSLPSSNLKKIQGEWDTIMNGATNSHNRLVLAKMYFFDFVSRI